MDVTWTLHGYYMDQDLSTFHCTFTADISQLIAYVDFHFFLIAISIYMHICRSLVL